ncbi:MAG: DUF721 domain-containing protein [Stellaceae bacterium]
MSSLARPGADDICQKVRGLHAIGVAVAKLAAPIVKKRGGGVLVRLKSEWATIVGAEWAASTWPTALARGGVLKLHCAPAVALELQHRAPLLIARLNRFFGREAVTRLSIVQALPPPAASARGPLASPVSAAEAAVVDRHVAGIGDPQLRAALSRLGRAVISAKGRNRRKG